MVRERRSHRGAYYMLGPLIFTTLATEDDHIDDDEK